MAGAPLPRTHLTRTLDGRWVGNTRTVYGLDTHNARSVTILTGLRTVTIQFPPAGSYRFGFTPSWFCIWFTLAGWFPTTPRARFVRCRRGLHFGPIRHLYHIPPATATVNSHYCTLRSATPVLTLPTAAPGSRGTTRCSYRARFRFHCQLQQIANAPATCRC